MPSGLCSCSSLYDRITYVCQARYVCSSRYVSRYVCSLVQQSETAASQFPTKFGNLLKEESFRIFAFKARRSSASTSASRPFAMADSVAGECSPTSSSAAADGKAAGFGRCQGCDGPRSFCSCISIPSLLLVVKGNVCFLWITTVLSSRERLCLVRTVQRCQGSSMDDPPAMKRSRVPVPLSLR